MINRILLASAVGLSLLAVAATGNASCISLGIENNLVANAGCELGTTNNDSQSDPLQVNLDTMFGYDDWLFAEKVLEDPEQVIDIGLTLTGDAESGSWSINDVWDSYSDIMLVFKGGGGNIEPSVYVGYLLVNGDISGSYTTPFVNGNNGNPTDISHVSAYLRHMPEPSSFVLVGISLVGLAAMRRRTT
jgi:hypothetical protein